MKTQTKCDHWWSYERRIWQAGKDDNSRVAVGRYCSKCGKMETAVASQWGPLPKSYVDMRKKLQEAIREEAAGKRMKTRKKLLCPTCRQDFEEPPHPGLRGKDCPQCGQGRSWRKARRKQKP